MKDIDRLKSFIAAIKSSKYQKGALVDLRSVSEKEIVLIGDLHARKDNLLKILNYNANLKKLKRNEIFVIILGDAVHSEKNLLEMDSSVAIMEFIMELKIQNKDNFYYLLGNHDYLSDMFIKGGIRQGLEYRKRLRDLFGEEYIALYEEFIYNSLLMLIANSLVAVHGGPVKSASSLSYIQDIKVSDESNISVLEAEWGRWKDVDIFGKESFFYYDEVDVKNFLDKIGMSEAFFIAGHSPNRDGNWHWQLMPRHHIIFAGHDNAGYAVFKDKDIKFIQI
ncbi:MAG: metallophosphoesterase [Candidatus Omnitrophota bacterium]